MGCDYDLSLRLIKPSKVSLVFFLVPLRCPVPDAALIFDVVDVITIPAQRFEASTERGCGFFPMFAQGCDSIFVGDTIGLVATDHVEDAARPVVREIIA